MSDMALVDLPRCGDHVTNGQALAQLEVGVGTDAPHHEVVGWDPRAQAYGANYMHRHALISSCQIETCMLVLGD